jgi:hypothetical protein
MKRNLSNEAYNPEIIFLSLLSNSHCDFSGASAIAIAAGGGIGSSHTCALLSGEIVKCWGSNSHGQLGIGSSMSVQNSPSTAGIESTYFKSNTWCCDLKFNNMLIITPANDPTFSFITRQILNNVNFFKLLCE